MKTIYAIALLTLAACGGGEAEEAAEPTATPEPTTGHETPQAVSEPVAEPTEPEAPPPPPPRAVKIRVIHAAVEHAEPMQVFVGREEVEADGANPPAIPPFGALVRDANAMVSAEGGPPGELVHYAARGWNDVIPIGPDVTRTTLVIYSGLEQEGGGVFGRAATDAATPPSAGTTRIRFFNALRGEVQVDVCAASPSSPSGANRRAPMTPIFTGVFHGRFADAPSGGNYADVPHGTRLAVRRFDEQAPCTGEVAVTLAVEDAAHPSDAMPITVVAAGKREGNRMVAHAIVCRDVPDGDCAEIPVPRR